MEFFRKELELELGFFQWTVYKTHITSKKFWQKFERLNRI